MWFFCCLSFSFILCGVFSLDIFDADFWSSYQSVLREVASLMEKLKFTALASRASWTSISYTRVFNRWRSFTAEVLDIFSPRIWSSGSSDDSQVNQLNQKLKLTMLASRASGTSEHYLRAFNRWAEFAKGVLGVPGFPVGPMDCALHLQFLLQSSNSASEMRFSASHIRKETLEVTHLKKLAERTEFGNLLQLRRMFVHAFSGFSGGSELC